MRNARHWQLMTSLALAGGLALVAGATVLPADAATTTGVATATVNIRSGPSTAKAVVGQLVKGQRISVTSSAVKGWVKVRFASGTAYMSAAYLNTTGKKLPAAPTTISAGTKITTETLNVRSGPATSYKIVGSLSEGTALISGTIKSGFASFTYGGAKRWVSITYLAKAVAASSAPPATPTASDRGEVALAFARKQLGKPYKYGAEGPNAYDCSGLAQSAWKAAGVSIPRVTSTQWKFGTKIAKADLQLGDLVFFYGPTPSHVAIYAGEGMVIHAPRPGKVVEYIKMSYMPYAGARRPG